MLKIGNLELGNKPNMVAVIDSLLPLEQITRLKVDGVDILEMRVDCYKEPFPEVVSYLEKVKNIGLPMIGTVRETDTNRSSRIEIFQAVIPLVDSIDIELGSPVSDSVLSLCKDKTNHSFRARFQRNTI